MISISDAIIRDLDLITVSPAPCHPDPLVASIILMPLTTHSSQIFRAMHTSYLSHICNPFHAVPNPLLPAKSNVAPPPPSEASLAASRKQIRSPLFERRMEKIAGWTSPDAPRPPPKPAAATEGTAPSVAVTQPTPPPPASKT